MWGQNQNYNTDMVDLEICVSSCDKRDIRIHAKSYLALKPLAEAVLVPKNTKYFKIN